MPLCMLEHDRLWRTPPHPVARVTWHAVSPVTLHAASPVTSLAVLPVTWHVVSSVTWHAISPVTSHAVSLVTWHAVGSATYHPDIGATLHPWEPGAIALEHVPQQPEVADTGVSPALCPIARQANERARQGGTQSLVPPQTGADMTPGLWRAPSPTWARRS